MAAPTTGSSFRPHKKSRVQQRDAAFRAGLNRQPSRAIALKGLARTTLTHSCLFKYLNSRHMITSLITLLKLIKTYHMSIWCKDYSDYKHVTFVITLSVTRRLFFICLLFALHLPFMPSNNTRHFLMR